MFSMFGGDKKDKSKEKPSCSSHDYIAEKLHKIDAENYAAAGILVYNPIGPERFEVLLGRSSSKHEIEFLGGKRDAEEDVWMTAAREFDEETGGVLGEIKKDLSQRTTLIKACKESSVLWYSRGRYALFLVPASKLHNLVIFDKPGDSLPSRHKAFVQSGKAKGKSSSYQEMQDLMWMNFRNPNLPQGQKARDFCRSVFDAAIFKVWLHSNIYGKAPYILHLSGLDWNTKKDDLKSLFDQVGSCKIHLEAHDDSSKFKTNGNGTVSFEDRHHATTAIYLFDKSMLSGRALSLTWLSADQSQATAAISSGHAGGAASAHASPSYSHPAVGAGAGAPSPAADPYLSGFQPAYAGMRGNPAVVSSPPPHVPPPAMSSALPVGWKEMRSADGRIYFEDTRTGQTQWERPPGPPPSASHSSFSSAPFMPPPSMPPPSMPPPSMPPPSMPPPSMPPPSMPPPSMPPPATFLDRNGPPPVAYGQAGAPHQPPTYPAHPPGMHAPPHPPQGY
jgi:8-oxo-dGTP pyrophosphatase MutT (NUDIX family)